MVQHRGTLILYFLFLIICAFLLPICVIYPAAVMKSALHADTAKEFLAYQQTDEAAKVFEGVGFTAM